MRQKTEQKRDAILAAGKALFLQQGYEKTSMAEVAAKVGGSKATLYSYFSSKEEIFSAVMQASAVKEIAPSFKKLDAHADVAQTLSQFGVNYLYSTLDPEILALRRLAQSEAERNDIGRKFFNQGPKIGWQMVESYLKKLSDSGQLSVDSPWRATMHLKGLLEAEVLDVCLLGVMPRPDKTALKAIVDEALAVFLRAYRL